MPEEILLAKQLNPNIPTLLLRYFDPKKLETLKPIEVSREVLSAHANILGINKESVSPELVNLMHKRAITVGVYTVNTEEWMKKLIDMDIDGIVSDYPDLLMRTLRSN
jgi:glycerophosphoryl diester phosphodiesterase